MLKTNKVVELKTEEKNEINGGFWPVVVAGGIAAAGLANGIYNGYQEAKRADKK
ncbi:TPA: class IIb bacteriocin, lactobin A/cerein 7B family [Bacillus mycoides]